MIKRAEFKKRVMIYFLICSLFSLSVMPRARANPVVAGAGIEAGVGAYVLAVLALSAGATLVGQPDTADRIKDHAYGVWDSTQAVMGAAWQASVQASASLAKDVKSPWVLGLYKDAYNALKPLPSADLRYDFLAPATLSTMLVDGKDLGIYGTNGSDAGIIIASISVAIVFRGMLIKNINWNISGYSGGASNVEYLDGSKKKWFPATGFDKGILPHGTNAANALAFASAIGASLYMKPSLTTFGAVSDDMLPRSGEDYKIKIPALDNFVPYPKTAAGSPDVTKGPLVVNPADSNTYKDATTGKVYNPADVAFDFPKPQVKTNTQTGAKEVGFVDTATGTWVKSTDTTTTDTGVGEGTIDLNPPTGNINWGPLRKVGNLFTTKFPFSIPWDLAKQLSIFNVSPEAPKFVIDSPNFFKWGSFHYSINFTVDLGLFDPVAIALRWIGTIAFDVGCILGLRKFMPE